jgi:hypothetical protein
MRNRHGPVRCDDCLLSSAFRRIPLRHRVGATMPTRPPSEGRHAGRSRRTTCRAHHHARAGTLTSRVLNRGI